MTGSATSGGSCYLTTTRMILVGLVMCVTIHARAETAYSIRAPAFIDAVGSIFTIGYASLVEPPVAQASVRRVQCVPLTSMKNNIICSSQNRKHNRHYAFELCSLCAWDSGLPRRALTATAPRSAKRSVKAVDSAACMQQAGIRA